MKSNLILAGAFLTLMTSVAFADPVVSLSGTDQMVKRGERIEHRLDKKGDRIEKRLDRKGDRVEAKLDNHADRQRAAGHYRKANYLERKGDAINHHLDKKGHRINYRLDKKGERIEHRHQHSARHMM